MSVSVSRSAPGAANLPLPEAQEEAPAGEAALKARIEAKLQKQQGAEKAVEQKGDKLKSAGTAHKDAVVSTREVNEARAIVEALVQSGVAPAAESPEDKHGALALFETFVPRLGKPTGFLAQDFSQRGDEGPLASFPRELVPDEAWHAIAAIAQAVTPDEKSLAHTPDLQSAFATLARCTEVKVDVSTLRSAPVQWARYAKIVEAFWKHDKTQLFQTPAATPQQIAAIAALKPHLEHLAQVMKSTYAPAVRRAQTATLASDVPMIPDSATHEMEEALGLRSFSEAGLAIAELTKAPEKLAVFKTALRAELEGSAAAGNVPASLRALAQSVAPTVRAFTGVDSNTADIDTLVWMVMVECAQTEEAIMRDQMREMQKQNALKKAQREKLAAMREGKARLEAQMQEEYHMLQATGEVHSSIDFETYKSWRKVAWGDGLLTEDGSFLGPKPTLTPRPPIPGWMKTGKLEQKNAAGGGTVQKYGLDADTEALLKSIYDKFPPEGRGEFQSWLSKFCPGLVDVSKLKGEAAIKAIRENLTKIAAALGDKSKITPTPPPNTATTSLEDAKNLARAIALKQALGIPLTYDENKRLKDMLDGLGDKAEEFNFWRDNQLAQELKNKAAQLKAELNACHDRVCQGWESDRDRDVYGMKIVNGVLMIEVFDDAVHSSRNEYKGWMSYEDLMHDTNGYPAADSNAKTPAIITEIVDMLRAGGVEPTFDENGTMALADNLAKGTPDAVPRATVKEKPKPIDQESINLDASEAKTQIQAMIDAYGEILRMGKNPDGSFYGTLSDEAQYYFDKLESAGKVTKGKSPDELRREEAEKAKAEQELKEFMQNGGPGKAEAMAMRLNHTGSLGELDAAVESEKMKLDSMGDMSALESMRLQQMMERRSKALEMLTNIMKKMAQVSDSIVANCK